MSDRAENAQRRNEVARWLAANDPDPCDPIEYDAAAYYRDFADALLASGWVVTPPAGEPTGCGSFWHATRGHECVLASDNPTSPATSTSEEA